MWEESKGLPQSLFWFARTSSLCALAFFGNITPDVNKDRSTHGLGTGAALQETEILPPLHICLHSHFVPRQEILKMSPKSYPRNTRNYLFRLESEGCHKAELFKVAGFASKYIFLLKLFFSFYLKEIPIPKWCLNSGAIFQIQWHPSDVYSTLGFFLFVWP